MNRLFRVIWICEPLKVGKSSFWMGFQSTRIHTTAMLYKDTLGPLKVRREKTMMEPWEKEVMFWQKPLRIKFGNVWETNRRNRCLCVFLSDFLTHKCLTFIQRISVFCSHKFRTIISENNHFFLKIYHFKLSENPSFFSQEFATLILKILFFSWYYPPYFLTYNGLHNIQYMNSLLITFHN